MSTENKSSRNEQQRRAMEAAHAITRRTVSETPQPIDYAATLAEALRIVQQGGSPARAAWEAMDGAGQLDALRRMTSYVRRRDGSIKAPRRAGEDGQPVFLPPVLDWAINAGDLDAVANEAYIQLYKMIERCPGDPLGILLFAAVISAARAIARAERRNARAVSYDGDDDLLRIIDDAAPMIDPAPRPEDAALLADLIDHAAHDDADMLMLEAVAHYETVTAAGRMAGVGHSSAARRWAAIQARAAEWARS